MNPETVLEKKRVAHRDRAKRKKYEILPRFIAGGATGPELPLQIFQGIPSGFFDLA